MREGDEPNDWAALTNRWGEWNSRINGLPVFTAAPLTFSVLMVAVGTREQLHEIVVGRMLVASIPNEKVFRRLLAYLYHYLRILVMMQFIDASEVILGLANGPLAMVVDSLALIFILELDKTLRLGSKKTLFGEAKAEVRKLHAQEIDKIASRLAAPVYGMTHLKQALADRGMTPLPVLRISRSDPVLLDDGAKRRLQSRMKRDLGIRVPPLDNYALFLVRDHLVRCEDKRRGGKEHLHRASQFLMALGQGGGGSMKPHHSDSDDDASGSDSDDDAAPTPPRTRPPPPPGPSPRSRPAPPPPSPRRRSPKARLHEQHPPAY